MKLNGKALTLLLSAGIVFSLSGCGGGSSTPTEQPPTESEPGPGEIGYQVLSEDNKTITYIGADYIERNATLTAAAAEYHTGVDFNNTLFDSADKKCQNCHNELYDTWKSSMHGQSWNDPIFQSKFQDFLRTHLAKIGSTSEVLYQQEEVGVGTKNMFSGVAQTCIKCHAPGAYYAGDVRTKVTILQSSEELNTTALTALKTEHERNLPNGEIAVIAANKFQNVIYKATFQIGHEANREGINCAFCHSIETPRLMKASIDGAMDNGEYKLVKTMREGPHGQVMASAGDTLYHSNDATDPHMNKFFRLWGPEKYIDYNATPKGGDDGTFDEGKQPSGDGRYTMASKDINGTNKKVHFTGGPFYGPYGVTGTTNENGIDDDTNRTALVNPHYDVEGNNHFGESGKGLCLSCHQRSAGAVVPDTEDGAGSFMELCSTQMAVTTGDDVASDDTASSPKCQKCHMERIEGTVLHQWARPDKLFTLADNPALTGHFDPEDPENYGDDNPVAAGWLNSHAFLGASKTGQKASVTAKIKSGFDATLDEWNNESVLVVTTTLANKTAHMFPGAHPMRRVLTRVIVTDESGNKIELEDAYGQSTFSDIVNNVEPLAGKKLHSSALDNGVVPVVNNGSENLDFPGKVADLTGDAVSSQQFDGKKVTIIGTDSTISEQNVSGTGVTTGWNKNAAIVDSDVRCNFTRIYGHETGKRYNEDGTPNKDGTGTFVVRPGFDSNMVANDNRLSPNETETYHLVYNIAGKTGVKVEYRVYYMQKGANGKFLPLESQDGFLKTENLTDPEAAIAKKLTITEVDSHSISLD